MWRCLCATLCAWSSARTAHRRAQGGVPHAHAGELLCVCTIGAPLLRRRAEPGEGRSWYCLAACLTMLPRLLLVKVSSHGCAAHGQPLLHCTRADIAAALHASGCCCCTALALSSQACAAVRLQSARRSVLQPTRGEGGRRRGRRVCAPSADLHSMWRHHTCFQGRCCNHAG